MFVERINPFWSSIIFASAVLLTTISTLSPLAFLLETVFKSSISSLPSFLTTILESTSDLEAVPPTWKVRSVNCVPGSPTDWAAITPTASPTCAILSVAKDLP